MKHILVLFIAAASIFSGPLRAQTNASQIIINRLLGLTENPTSTNTSDFADVGQNTILAHGGAFFLINGYSGYSSCLDASSNWPGFNFTAPFGAISSTSIPSELICSSGLDLAHKGNGMKPLSVMNADSCGNAINAAYSFYQSGYNYGPAYDTMKWYISHCYETASASYTWGTFGGSLDSVTGTQAGRQNVFDFVLYALGLRSDDDWFCDAVPYLGVLYQDTTAVSYGLDYRDQMAIYKFLMDNPRCASNYSDDSMEYYDLLNSYYNLWEDTSHSPEKFDTTLPTLQELGLDTLLVITAEAGVTYAAPTPQIILSASIIENPFESSTSIALSVGREAYITIQVFDLLGHQIAGAGYAGVFEQGSREIPIDMQNAPSGTYYVRIQTANNETQTLKLVKE